MGIVATSGVVLIVLAIAVVMPWGAFEALVRCGRLLWRLLTSRKEEVICGTEP